LTTAVSMYVAFVEVPICTPPRKIWYEVAPAGAFHVRETLASPTDAASPDGVPTEAACGVAVTLPEAVEATEFCLKATT